MNSEQPHASGRDITVKIGATVASAIVSKIIVLLLLGGIAGYFMAKDAARQVEKADEISLGTCSEEVCFEEVQAYKKLLDASSDMVNPGFTIPIMMLAMFMMFGFYEVMAWLIGLAVRKVIDT